MSDEILQFQSNLQYQYHGKWLFKVYIYACDTVSKHNTVNIEVL